MCVSAHSYNSCPQQPDGNVDSDDLVEQLAYFAD